MDRGSHLDEFGMLAWTLWFQRNQLRAFTPVKLNSYIAILASPKHKKCSTSMYVKLKNFCFKLPYEATFGFVWKVKLKL